MPKYLVTLPDGRKFHVTADRQPTEEEVLAQVSAGTAKPPSAAREWAEGMEQSSNPVASQVGGATAAVMDKGWSEALPYLGGAIGSLLGGKKTLPGTVAAGVGGGLGELGREVIQGESPSLKNVLKATAIQGGGELVGRGMQGGLRKAGTKLYTANLKPSARLTTEFPDSVQQLMKDRVTISQGDVMGRGRLERLMNRNNTTATQLATAADAGGAPPILGSEIGPSFNRLRRTLVARERGGTDVSADEQAIDEMVDRLRNQPPSSITEGIRTKRAQQDLADKAWRQSDAGTKVIGIDDELAKSSASGWRSAIDKRVPELAPVNRELQRRLGGSQMLDNAIQREANKDAFGMRDAIGMVGGGLLGYAMGDPATAVATYLGIRGMSTPITASAAGIMANDLGNVPIAQVIRAMVLANMAKNQQASR